MSVLCFSARFKFGLQLGQVIVSAMKHQLVNLKYFEEDQVFPISFKQKDKKLFIVLIKFFHRQKAIGLKMG